MSEKKNIENLLKDKLNKQEFVIQDKWMDDMSSMLDDYNEEPKSKKGLFFILTGLLLLIGLIGTLFILKKDIKAKTYNQVLTESNQKIEDTFINSKTRKKKNLQVNCEEHEYSEGNNKTVSQGSNEVNFIEKNRKISEEKRKEKKTIITNKSILIKEKSSVKNKVETKHNKKEKAEGSQKVLNEKKSFSKKAKITESNNSIVLAKNEKVSSQDKNYNSKTNQIYNLKKGTQSKQALSDDFESETSSDLKIDEEFNEVKNKEIPATNNLSVVEEKLSKENILQEVQKDNLTSENNLSTENSNLNDSINEETELELPNENLNQKEEKLEKKNEIKDLGLSLAVTAGASFLFRDFDSENTKRVNEESNKISWNASLEIYKIFKNRLIIGAGINLTNYGEKVNYSTLEIPIQDTITTIKENNYINVNLKRIQGVYTFDSSSITIFDTTHIFKDSIYLNEKVSQENGNTNFMYLEIPVKIGYKIIDSKNFAINAMTGVSFGFLLQNQGYYINSENNLELSKSQTVLFNYLLSADFIYKINKNINLTISPHFKYNLNNLSRSDATKRKYSSFCINGGVIFDF